MGCCNEAVTCTGCALAQPVSHDLAAHVCRDYALIAEEEVELAPGLNVVTGESGAGKSVLVTCLGQLLGAPAAENCIRPPASSAIIEGTLHLPANAVVLHWPLKFSQALDMSPRPFPGMSSACEHDQSSHHTGFPVGTGRCKESEAICCAVPGLAS